MALDEKLRATLRSAVPRCRELLTKNLEETLEAIFGIHRSGQFEPTENLPEVRTDSKTRETHELLQRILPDPPKTKAEIAAFEESFDSVLRSLAFTHLNRLVAFKMLEHPTRRVIRESVGRGPGSNGLRYYMAYYPEEEARWKSGDKDTAYRNFLLWRCAELNREIGVLFDPADVASRIFPRPKTLQAVLEVINDPGLAEVWAHEEAIGWVYQYYTPRELREKARKQSPTPRNSYEMAFRNQFYTPEYVVRFLTDNTLGRIWLEMKPESALREQCAYLVIRPDQPLPKRKKKDPREIRVIDPACGSGHFLLYAFDLFETIYREAYDDHDLGPALKKDFSDRDAFFKSVPKLIVENNLHGIDIDKRATQLASLTLFLRAKSRNKDAQIERSLIACAEPIPGGRQLFEDFKAGKLKNRGGVASRILDAMRQHLELADEAGSLLKAEREMGRLVGREHEEYRRRRARGGEQEVLFAELRKPRQGRLDFSDVTDEQFWERVESNVEGLLSEYATESDGAEGAHRRIFANDGIQSLRFLDLLGKWYDVVLMNPPFGKPTRRSKSYIAAAYPLSGNDVFAAFIDHWLDRMVEPRGRLGAITSRTGFFLKSFTKWREEVLLGRTNIEVVADLGAGVLDTAMVETAAYVLELKDERRGTMRDSAEKLR